ncbi:DNA polymerase III subunit beta [Patescibacteria group bacterium]|nr:DNA polymerase III subunit beta [Patescibacteria group bacterium]
MKFICTQENLITGINIVVNIAGKNTTLPILNNIKIKTTGSGLELVSTNLEIAVTTFIRGKTEEEGEITLPAKLLAEAVSLMSKENITIFTQGSDVVLLTEKNKTTLRGVPVDDFPVIPKVNQGTKLTLPNQTLVDGLSRVIFTVNTLENRPEIAGVCVCLEKEEVVLVGTDSYRLAEARLVVKKQESIINLLIPLKTGQEIIRLFSGKEGDLNLLIDDNQFSCSLEGVELVSRLINGQYPDYQQIIPQKTTTKLKVNKNILIQAVKAASLFVRSGINDIKVLVDTTNKELVVSSLNGQLGENMTKINPTEIVGESLEIIFNYRYLLDGLQAIEGGEVGLEMVSASSPVIIKPTEQKGYLYLLMPIKQ